MATGSESRPTRWRRGAQADWTKDERDYARLLDALTRDLVTTASTLIEMDSPAPRSQADVGQEQDRIARVQFEEARSELVAFAEALLDARLRSGEAGREEARYDSASPDENEHADLLIQYLVRLNYAEARTEEPDPGHYVYYIRIAWDRLKALAAEHGARLKF